MKNHIAHMRLPTSFVRLCPFLLPRFLPVCTRAVRRKVRNGFGGPQHSRSGRRACGEAHQAAGGIGFAQGWRAQAFVPADGWRPLRERTKPGHSGVLRLAGPCRA